MSDHIPLEIQIEIIKRLPVKSLIQFLSVSKTWKSLIESSNFIISHSTTRQTQPQHLLVSHDNLEPKGFSVVVDDDTFPRQNVSPSVPILVNMLKSYRIIGSSHGLLCLYGTNRGTGGSDSKMAVLWNLSIRKAVAVVVPSMNLSDIGFGFCRETNDLKILKIPCYWFQATLWDVEVFTLSTGAWRSPYGNIPRKSIQFSCLKVDVDGFLYWLATDWYIMDGRPTYYNLIISFDITSEEFEEVNLPDIIAHLHGPSLIIFKLRESVAVLEPSFEDNTSVYHVWMMEDGVPKSFTKLFAVNTPNAIVRGFTKSGEPVIEIMECDSVWGHRSLAAYEAASNQINNVRISEYGYSYSVFLYMETLQLLDQPDFIIYDQGKRYISKGIDKSLKEHNAVEGCKQDSRKTLKLWRFCKVCIMSLLQI